MMTYILMRDVDESGISGTGFVAWAVEFPHGLTVVSFRDDIGPRTRSVAVYESKAEAERVHGHGGKTRFVRVTRAATPSSSDFEKGIDDCMMDAMENAPFASLGGVEKRAAFKPAPYMTPERIAGYVSEARRQYGADWQTCGFGWAPAITILPEPHDAP